MSYSWWDQAAERWVEVVGDTRLPGAAADGGDWLVYPAFVENLGPERRTEAGFKKTVETAVPQGHNVIGRSVVDVDGEPTEQWELEEVPLADMKAAKQEAVRNIRWEKETGGITISGTPIRTDEKSQAKINGAVSLLQLDPDRTQINSWEAVPGMFVSLSRGQIQQIGLAVGNHIQACFDRSHELCSAIEAATTAEELAAIDINTGWPTGD